MSARKLQQEIDKVFKKVKEGLDVFDQHYDKLQMCESQPQKEKLESDLKKEIKKLQRQRDQIKNWISGNEVKDKKPLMEKRREIENAMERFKEVEKNMKTKAFSKEGLNNLKVDPKQKEKDDVSEFLQNSIDELDRQNEKHDAIIDQIQSSGKKGRKLDTSKQSEIDELAEKVERNKWHQEKLEQILRLVANDVLDFEQVNELREDINYYVESNEDADFLEDDQLYEDLALDDIEEQFGTVGEFAPVKEEEYPDFSIETPKKTSVSEVSGNNSVAPAGISSVSNNNGPVSTPSKPQQTFLHNINSAVSTPTTTIPPIAPNLKPAIVQKTEMKYASVASAALNNSVNNTPKTPAAALHNGVNALNGNDSILKSSSQPSPMVPPPGLGGPSKAPLNFSSLNGHSTTQQIRTSEPSQPEPKQAPPASVAPAAPSAPPSPPKEDPEVAARQLEQMISNILNRPMPEPSFTTTAIDDLFDSFTGVKERLQDPEPFVNIAKILETSLLNCPDSLDSDKPRSYQPKNPHPSPIYYPQEPLPELSYSSVVSKLDLSTLFFNFYYCQGEYIQILSARELVKKGWAFDKVSKKWYQKVEEIQPPSLVGDKLTNPEKKVTWKYYDNEGVWLSRRKDDFDPDSSVELVTSF